MTRMAKRTVDGTSIGPLALTLVVLACGSVDAEAQNPNRRGDDGGGATIDLSARVVTQVRDYYASHQVDAEALPPGIRRRVAQGKPLPPGIAKKVAPPELQTAVDLPAGYELVEVGLDVVLVEAATNIVHDVLMDVIR